MYNVNRKSPLSLRFPYIVSRLIPRLHVGGRPGNEAIIQLSAIQQ